MTATESESGFAQWVPMIFVLLWSTGFIGAKYALPFIEPFNLLFVRMLITLAVFSGLIVYLKSPWPNFGQACHQMVVGSLIHGAYLGGVFAAIKWQMPAGITSLLVGLQPLLTGLLAWTVIGDRLRKRQWLGLMLGLVGVCMVLLRGQELGTFSLTLPAVIAAIVALIGISAGTLYQKRFGQGIDLMTGAWFQYLATAVWMGVLTYVFENQTIDWQPQLILSLTWLVFGLSVTAILLLMLMIRQGAASEVAGYFYLVPPVTAIESWLLFNEQLGFWAIFGMLVAVSGVYLVIKSPQEKGREQ